MGRVVGLRAKSDDLDYRILKIRFYPVGFSKSRLHKPILFSDGKIKIRSSESDRIIISLRPTTMRFFCWWLYVSFRRLRGIWSQIWWNLIRITSYGACLVEKMFFLVDSTDDKIWPYDFFRLPFSTVLFPPVEKVVENVFVRDLGGIIQRYMGYRLGCDESRGLYALATLVRYTAWTRTSPVHRLASRGRA